MTPARAKQFCPAFPTLLFRENVGISEIKPHLMIMDACKYISDDECILTDELMARIELPVR